MGRGANTALARPSLESESSESGEDGGDCGQPRLPQGVPTGAEGPLLFSSLSASSTSDPTAALPPRSIIPAMQTHTLKHWRTDNWKPFPPAWSEVSSLSDSTRTRLSSESDGSSEGSSVESLEASQEETGAQKRAGLQGTLPDRKNSLHLEGMVPSPSWTRRAKSSRNTRLNINTKARRRGCALSARN